MSIEKSQQMNNKQMNTNHKGHPDSADLRRDGIFYPDSEAVFPAVTSPWEVVALFDSERNL